MVSHWDRTGRRHMRDNGSPEYIEIASIVRDGHGLGTQLREVIDPDTVERYAEDMARDDVFPLVDLVEVGDGTYLIADGWHRVRARERLEKTLVQAVVHSVPDGAEPLDVAIKLSLRANNKHGLRLTRGDQKKKARAALLLPDYRGWSLRALEVEIGVGKSTLGRVRTQLIKEGCLAHPVFGSKMPEWVPDDHASVYFLNNQFADENEMQEVYAYVSQLLPQGDAKDWEWDQEEQRVIHGGLIEGAVVTFAITDNPTADGLPSTYEEVIEEDEEEGEEEATSGRHWEDLSQGERDRIEAAKARREFNRAAMRIKDRGDKELTRAVNTLAKRADEPGLWEDIRTLVISGGPAEDHKEEMF